MICSVVVLVVALKWCKTGSKGLKTTASQGIKTAVPRKQGATNTMQHRGLHARSVHANSISRHCWVMVRRGFCLCYRDDMKIETCMLPTSPPGMDGILASNILFRGSWSSDGQTSPPLSSVVFPCLGHPGRPQNPHDARCWLFIVGCPVACFLSRFLVDSQHQHPKTTCATAPTAQRNIPTIGIIALHSFKIFLSLPTGFPRGRRRVIADRIYC